MGVPPWLWKPPYRNSGDSEIGLTPMAIWRRGHGTSPGNRNPVQRPTANTAPMASHTQLILMWMDRWFWSAAIHANIYMNIMNIWIFAENWKWSPWVKYHHSPTWWFSKHPNHQLPPNHHWFPRGKHPFSTGNTGIPCSTSPRFSRRSCARNETELSWQSALRATSAGSISSQGLKETKLKSMSTYLEMNVKCVYHVYRSCIKPITISWFQAISRIRCGYNNQPC